MPQHSEVCVIATADSQKTGLSRDSAEGQTAGRLRWTVSVTCERATVQAKTVSWCHSLVRPSGPMADSRLAMLQPGAVTALSKLAEALKSSAAVTALLKPL